MTAPISPELDDLLSYFWHSYDGGDNGCGKWYRRAGEPQCCPVLQSQVDSYADSAPTRAGRAIFLPEPICGRPENDVLFVGVNPNTKKGNTQAEMEWCLNTIENPHLGGDLKRKSYLDYYRSWYEDEMESPRYDNEPITGKSLQLLKEALSQSDERNWGDQEILPKVTILNTVHCKSNGAIGVEDVRDVCGRQSFRLLLQCAPYAAVVYGRWNWEDWLNAAAGGIPRVAAWTNGEADGETWSLDVDEVRKVASQRRGRVWMTRTSDEFKMALIFSYHPSSRGEFANTRNDVVNALAEALSERNQQPPRFPA